MDKRSGDVLNQQQPAIGMTIENCRVNIKFTVALQFGSVSVFHKCCVYKSTSAPISSTPIDTT